MVQKRLGGDHLPPFSGAMLFGMPCILISDVDALEDVYIKKNPAFSKHELERAFGPPLVYNNIVNMETDNPDYSTKRKVLSSAFFKNKVQRMVNMVKETTLDQFTKLQAKGEKVEVNLAQYTQVLQSHIIMNILCGEGCSTRELDYVGEGMKHKPLELADFVDALFWDAMGRMASNPLILLYPPFYAM